MFNTVTHLSSITRLAFDIEVVGRKNIPVEHPYIVVSNHQAFYDPFVIQSAIGQPIRWIGVSYIKEIAIVRRVSQLMGTIHVAPNGRTPPNTIEKMVQTAQRSIVGLFPEGYRPVIRLSPSTEVLPFQRGFAFLAAHTERPVLPISIVPYQQNIAKYPFSPSFRSLFFHRKEFVELVYRRSYRSVRLVIHPTVMYTNHDRSRTAINAFAAKVESIVRRQIYTYKEGDR